MESYVTLTIGYVTDKFIFRALVSIYGASLTCGHVNSGLDSR